MVNISIVGSHDSYLRLSFFKAFASAGYNVNILCTKSHPELVKSQLNIIEYPALSLKRPWSFLIAVLSILNNTKKQHTEVIHSFDTSQNIICGIVSILCPSIISIRTINGIGRAYCVRSLGSWLYRYIYISLMKVTSLCVDYHVFQNPHDRNLFIKHRICSYDNSCIIPGSGIDVARSNQLTLASSRSCLREHYGFDERSSVVYIGRINRLKGIQLFLDTAKLVTSLSSEFSFYLCGPLEDPEHPDYFPLTQIMEYEHYVKYLGTTSQPLSFLYASDVLFYPSMYGEGIPRVVLQAISVGTAIITSTAPGCGDIVTKYNCGHVLSDMNSHSAYTLLRELDTLRIRRNYNPGTITSLSSASVNSSYLSLYSRLLA